MSAHQLDSGEDFDVFAGQCQQQVCAPFERRPANALNVEPIQPLHRCKLKPPEHWPNDGPTASRWLLSGGSPLVFGMCTQACPARSHGLLVDAIERGAVVAAEHPNFGGTVTVGPYHIAVGGIRFAMLHTGGTSDVTDDDFKTAADAARAFSYQVGWRRALAAAARWHDER